MIARGGYWSDQRAPGVVLQGPTVYASIDTMTREQMAFALRLLVTRGENDEGAMDCVRWALDASLSSAGVSK